MSAAIWHVAGFFAHLGGCGPGVARCILFGKDSGTKICGAICERKGVGALFGPYEKEKGRFFMSGVFVPFLPG